MVSHERSSVPMSVISFDRLTCWQSLAVVVLVSVTDQADLASWLLATLL